MIKFDTYRLLNESLGLHSLGVAHVQSLGIQSNLPGIGEAGMPPFEKKKPAFGDEKEGGPVPPDDMGDEELPPEEGEGDELGDEMGGEEGPPIGDKEGEGSIEDRIAELEAELAALKAEIGDGEEGELGDEDAELDHEDDLGDLGDDEEGDFSPEDEEGEDEEEGDEEEGDEEGMPFGKKPAAPFMKKMKKECDGKGGMLLSDKKGSEGKPTFMMKKAKKCSSGAVVGKKKKMEAGDFLPMKKGCKNCSKGCKKCKAMKKESTGYERPTNFDPSEAAFLRSIREQLASSDVRKKWTNGMEGLKKEDLLLPPPSGLESLPEPKTIQAGEVGYATQGRVGSDEFTAESIQDIMSRLARLERGN